MSNSTLLIGFKKKTENCFSIVKQQRAFAIIGGAGFLLFLFLSIKMLIDDFDIVALISSIVFAAFSLTLTGFFTALGLFRVETEINLNTRKASITRKNFRGQKSTREFNLDDIGITAIHFGRAGGAGGVGVSSGPHWVVKAGFQTEDYDTAIYSQEVSSKEDRNKVMLDLYRFFFPDDTQVTESDIKADANKAILQKPA